MATHGVSWRDVSLHYLLYAAVCAVHTYSFWSVITDAGAFPAGKPCSANAVCELCEMLRKLISFLFAGACLQHPCLFGVAGPVLGGLGSALRTTLVFMLSAVRQLNLQLC